MPQDLEQRIVDPIGQVVQSFIEQHHCVITHPNTVLGFLREHNEHFQLVDAEEFDLSDEAFLMHLRKLKPKLRQVGIFIDLDPHTVGSNCYISDNSHERRGFSFEVFV